MHDELLLPILSDIIDGRSVANCGGSTIYVKHPSFRGELSLSSEYRRLFDLFKPRGLPTTEERLAFLKAEGDWTDKDESFISVQKKFLDNLRKTSTKLVIASQIGELEKTIKDTERKIAEKLFERERLLGATCEKCASEKKQEVQIFRSIFTDHSLSVPVFTLEEWDDLGSKDVAEINRAYFSIFENFTEGNLKKIALCGIFYNLYSVVPKENPASMFGANVFDLTFFQQRILRYAQDARYIFEHTADIPDEIRDDYDELLKFSQRDTKGLKHKGAGNGYSVVGASKDEMKRAGVNTDGAISPFEALRKSGKTSLNKRDFLNLSNPV